MPELEGDVPSLRSWGRTSSDWPYEARVQQNSDRAIDGRLAGAERAVKGEPRESVRERPERARKSEGLISYTRGDRKFLAGLHSQKLACERYENIARRLIALDRDEARRS